MQTPPRRSPPVFNLPRVVLGLIAICVGLHFVRHYILTLDQDLIFLINFSFIPARYSGEYLIDLYAFTGPITYAFLHGSIPHLAVNMIWLAAFGSPLASRLGTVRFLLFWVLASLGAVGLHYVLYPHDLTPLVGASGAISGMMGAAARFGFQIDRRVGNSSFAGDILPIAMVMKSRTVVTFLGIWIGINLLMGLGFGAPEEGSRIAWEAHIGGFVIGFFLLRPFDRRPPRRPASGEAEHGGLENRP